MKRRCVFRVDASSHIGTGHVMRCLSLAGELKKIGYEAFFVMRPQLGDLISFVEDRGYCVKSLPNLNGTIPPRFSDDYESWLQVTELEDAKDFLSLATDMDVVVIDHYGINLVWEDHIKSRSSCKLVVIDDLVREHKADVIVDQTHGVNANDYLKNSEAGYVMAGSAYAMLGSQFSKSHLCSLKNKNVIKNHKILLSMGGVDKPNATLSILEALIRLEPKVNTTVLLSERSPHYSSVTNFCNKNKTWVEHIRFIDNMADFMLSHTIGIGAPGATSWERVCIGLPSILIPLADNQKKNCASLVGNGLALSLELNEIPHNFIAKLDELIFNFEDMRRKNLEICDGMGAKRIALTIKNLDIGSLTLKNAADRDIDTVFKWQCLPETRRYANDDSMPTWHDHETWMHKKLRSQTDFFYIIFAEDQDVGVVRLDQSSTKVYVISIYIVSTHHGKGIAKKALAVIDELHPNVRIIAEVKQENLASVALFESAGYSKEQSEIFVRKPLVDFGDV
jgi:UDP-2,4-diacetamido-2,4,6-trideoxy-beta-L-altropyranose hydrolase